MNSSKVRYLYLLTGVVGGFVLGSTLAGGFSTVFNKILSVAATVSLVVFGKRMERSEHAQHLLDWGSIRTRGQSQFIFVRYILLRGGLLSTVFIAPVWKALDLWTQDAGYFVMIVALVFFVAIYLGGEEWKTCEREFEIRRLRQEAEEEREAASLVN